MFEINNWHDLCRHSRGFSFNEIIRENSCLLPEWKSVLEWGKLYKFYFKRVFNLSQDICPMFICIFYIYQATLLLIYCCWPEYLLTVFTHVKMQQSWFTYLTYRFFLFCFRYIRTRIDQTRVHTKKPLLLVWHLDGTLRTTYLFYWSNETLM